MIIIIIGIICIFFSSSLSKKYLRKSGIPQSEWRGTAGKGIVPTWVSGLNIIAWTLIIIGVLSLVT